MSNPQHDQDPVLQQEHTGTDGPADTNPHGDYAGAGESQSVGPEPTGSQSWQPRSDRYIREDRSRRRKESGLPYKSPILAALLSCMPGLGQVYVGYYQQGFQFVLTVAGIIAILNMGIPGSLSALFGTFLAFFWIFNMIDAHRRAHHYNRALDGLVSDTVPDDFEMPGIRGSMPVGIILIIVGVLTLLDLNTNISMEWLENWWPLVLVGAGLWLVLRARRQEG